MEAPLATIDDDFAVSPQRGAPRRRGCGFVLWFALAAVALVGAWMAIRSFRRRPSRDDNAPKPIPYDPDAPSCEEYGMCICEAPPDKGHVVGKYLAADPEKKLVSTHNLKTINGENALAWFARQGEGKGCGSLTCPLMGDELVFQTREKRWTVTDMYDTPKEKKDPDNAKYDPDWKSWRAKTYGEEPQDDYFPACV